jgi:hypothetical protein
MAWTFPDYWINPLVLAGTTDTRSFWVVRSTGGVYNGAFGYSAAFDYFADTATVNDFLLIGVTQMAWGLQFTVGTPMVAASIQLIWEFWNGSAWQTLPVDNLNPFAVAGVQSVRFTPPKNWSVLLISVYACFLRCRIVAVSGLTEGGANATNQLKANLRGLLVTGTDANGLAGARTADRAGSYQLFTGTPAATLTPLEMPVYALNHSAKVDVVLAGCTLGAGASVTLTGKDIENNTVSETLDVSAGNGTYPSNLVYSNLTLVACTGFADGTITVNQKRWGVVEYAASTAEYKLNAKLRVGDGSTATTFSMHNQTAIFRGGHYWQVEGNATFNCGGNSGAGSGSGSTFMLDGMYTGILHYWNTVLGSGIMNHKGCLYYLRNTSAQFPLLYFVSGTTSFQDCVFRGGRIRMNTPISMVRCKLIDAAIHVLRDFTSGSYGVESNAAFAAETTSAVTLDQVKLSGCTHWLYAGSTYTYLDSPIVPAAISVGYNDMGNSVDKMRIQYRLALKVTTPNGTPLAGARVIVTNAQGQTPLNVLTDANGDIVTTALNYATGSHTNPSISFVWKYYDPHVITVTMPGYQTAQMTLTMDRKREEIMVLQPSVDLLLPMAERVYRNLEPANGQNQVMWLEV